MANAFSKGDKVRDTGAGYPNTIGTERVGTVVAAPGDEFEGEINPLFYVVTFEDDGAWYLADGTPWYYTATELVSADE